MTAAIVRVVVLGLAVLAQKIMLECCSLAIERSTSLDRKPWAALRATDHRIKIATVFWIEQFA
jgi:hypothetical protein